MLTHVKLWNKGLAGAGGVSKNPSACKEALANMAVVMSIARHPKVDTLFDLLSLLGSFPENRSHPISSRQMHVSTKPSKALIISSSTETIVTIYLQRQLPQHWRLQRGPKLIRPGYSRR